jgi:tetratricopeptide (TPR) repeat protein
MTKIVHREKNLYFLIPEGFSLIAQGNHWFEEGLNNENQGNLLTALACYERAIFFDPQRADAWVNIGVIRFRRHKFKKAEIAFRRAVEVDPQYALAYFNLGKLFECRGHYCKEATVWYEKAIESQPDYGDALWNLARLYEDLRNPLRAAHHWRAYIRCAPDVLSREQARGNLARIRSCLKRA